MPKDHRPCRVAVTLPRCELELYRTLRHIVTHPLNRRHKLRALWRFARWQTVSRLWNDKIVAQFIGSSRLLVSRGMVGATGSIYYGLPEFEDMALVLHALRPGDSFIDVGANVGSYTVLAAAVANANVIAFEPIPATFVHLMDNIRLNALEQRVSARNQGVGTERGVRPEDRPALVDVDVDRQGR